MGVHRDFRDVIWQQDEVERMFGCGNTTIRGKGATLGGSWSARVEDWRTEVREVREVSTYQ